MLARNGSLTGNSVQPQQQQHTAANARTMAQTDSRGDTARSGAVASAAARSHAGSRCFDALLSAYRAAATPAFGGGVVNVYSGVVNAENAREGRGGGGVCVLPASISVGAYAGGMHAGTAALSRAPTLSAEQCGSCLEAFEHSCRYSDTGASDRPGACGRLAPGGTLQRLCTCVAARQARSRTSRLTD